MLLNPFSGTKRAVKIWKKVVETMLERSHATCDVRETEHQNHAKEIAEKTNLQSYDAIVSISGDGLVHEIINGIMSRPDWAVASQVPVGVIPSGTGNAIAKSLQTPEPISATLNIIKGNNEPWDIWSVRQLGQPTLYSHVVCFWGLLADIDLESEKFRWAGTVRRPTPTLPSCGASALTMGARQHPCRRVAPVH